MCGAEDESLWEKTESNKWSEEDLKGVWALVGKAAFNDIFHRKVANGECWVGGKNRCREEA